MGPLSALDGDPPLSRDRQEGRVQRRGPGLEARTGPKAPWRRRADPSLAPQFRSRPAGRAQFGRKNQKIGLGSQARRKGQREKTLVLKTGAALAGSPGHWKLEFKIFQIIAR